MKRLALTCMIMGTVTLSGCAQIANFGDLMWTETKHVTVKGADKLSALLRPRAQRQEPVFAQYESVPSQLRTQSYGSLVYGDTPIDLEMYELVYEWPEQGTGYYGEHDKMIANEAKTQRELQAANQYHVDYALAGAPMRPTEPEMPNLSYVKISGATSISDWQECQVMAGGYIEPMGNGFAVRSDFDYCMRVKGYMPEADAISFMDTQMLP